MLSKVLIALMIALYIFCTWVQLYGSEGLALFVLSALLLIYLLIQAGASVSQRGVGGTRAYGWFLLYFVGHALGLLVVMALLSIGAAGTFEILGMLVLAGGVLYMVLLWIAQRIRGWYEAR